MRRSRGETSPTKSVQTRNLERRGVTVIPDTTDVASQTAHQSPFVIQSRDGLVVSFPCGSTLDVHSPAWMPPAPGPEDED